MDNKRKSRSGRPSVDLDERASKRRRIPQDSNSSHGESSETTTELGLSFLEQIRRTADKNGRLVAGHFENLLPRQGNEEYYRKTKMPISLEQVERKLNDREFATMTELESYFKRMVSNAKDFYPRSSQVFEDAERVRKALSNYMVKNNPAYQTKGYQAFPTPLPPEDASNDEDGDADEKPVRGRQTNGKKLPKETDQVDSPDEAEGDEEDGEGDEAEDDGDDAEEDENENEEEEEEEEEEDADADADEEEEPVLIVPKRRGPGRPPKNPVLHAQKMAAKAAQQGKADSQYQNVPYKGLGFQQAQEKIIEEMLRKKGDGYEYFEPFINLPTRALKDYYRIISEPLSIRKLQKMVKGIHGRGDTVGVSDFKSWNAFQEKSSLLWKNAYYYNEEGSDIYDLAKELEEFFKEQLEEAKKVVQEPPQPPKIKLKVPNADSSAPSKKITIHVGGRSGSTDSQTPVQSAASQNGDAPGTGGATIIRRTTASATPANPLDKTRSVSVASPSPSIRAKPVDEVGVAAPSTPNGVGAAPQMNAASASGNINVPPQPQAPPPPPPNPVWDKPFRAKDKGLSDGLMASLVVRSHSNAAHLKLPTLSLNAAPHLCHRSQTYHIALKSDARIGIYPQLSDSFQKLQRPYQLWVLHNGRVLQINQIGNPGQRSLLCETMAVRGLNTIEAQVIAEIPADKRVPGGPQAELEKFTIYIHVQSG